MHLDVHPFIIQDHCNLSYEIIIGNCGVNEFLMARGERTKFF